MLRIQKENHITVMSGSNKPCVQVEPGTRLVMETFDALGGQAEYYYRNNIPYKEYAHKANPSTGPVYIKGAVPGDVISVYIHDIRLHDTGFINMHPGRFENSGGDWGNDFLQVCIGNGAIIFDGRCQIGRAHV